MNTAFTRTRSLSLTFALSALYLAAAHAQTQPQLSDALPVTMGLWQTETNATVTGVENTPMAGMAAAMGRAHVSQSCLTPDKWKSDIQGFNARQQHGCTLSNLHQDSHEVSFDEVCQSERGGANNAHVDILIDSAEHSHGKVVMTIANPALPQPITITTTMVSHYVSPACGDVKPGEGKMIQ